MMNSKDKRIEVEMWNGHLANFKVLESSGSDSFPDVSKMINYLEMKKLFKYLNLNNNKIKFNNVLDLGAGTGRFSIAFSPYSNQVFAVEPFDLFFKLNQTTEGYKNIIAIKNTAQDFATDNMFDIIIISGLLLYLADDEAINLLEKYRSRLSNDGKIVIRDFIYTHNRKIETDNYFHCSRDKKTWWALFLESDLRLMSYFPTHAPLFLSNISYIIKILTPVRIFVYTYMKVLVYYFGILFSPLSSFLYRIFDREKCVYFILKK